MAAICNACWAFVLKATADEQLELDKCSMVRIYVDHKYAYTIYSETFKVELANVNHMHSLGPLKLLVLHKNKIKL